MDDARIMELVAERLSSTPSSAKRMMDGQRSEVWSVAIPDQQVMVRVNARAEVFAATQHNLEVLADLGLPVPRVLAADLTGARFPVPYLILTKIPGRDLRHELASMTEAQMTRLAEKVVGFQKQVTSLPLGTGCGYVGIGERGPRTFWWDVALGQSEWDVSEERPGARHHPEGANIAGLQARVRRLIADYEAYLRAVPPTCFLDDITVKNVLVEDGELRGLVDFDVVCYGDPLFWLGLTATGVVSDVGVRELFYVQELCRFLGLADEQRRVFLLYAAWIALGFMERFTSTETPAWSARMEGTVEEWVTELEGGSPVPR